MTYPYTVVVYGTSLFSSTVEASLRRQPAFAVMQVDNQQSDALAHLSLIQPHVILVDMTDVLVETVMRYLVEQPATMLIVLNSRTGGMFIEHDRHTALTTMQQLMGAIEEHVARPTEVSAQSYQQKE
ncbi:MAG: hypothetical protein HC837_08820 [Chloroflexaceae bacterium]|nr:hypothetical protein [Chloroflexaceae bacterium]